MGLSRCRAGAHSGGSGLVSVLGWVVFGLPLVVSDWGHPREPPSSRGPRGVFSPAQDSAAFNHRLGRLKLFGSEFSAC
jgi:hypothetical protein